MASSLAKGPRHVAHARSASRTSYSSRSSASAAVDLVVKPSTPPKPTLALCGAAVLAAKPATPPRPNRSEVGNASVLQTIERQPVEAVLAEEHMPKTSVEVLGLGGGTYLKEDFLLCDRVLAVKQTLQTTRKFPLWQQLLSFQGEILDDQSTLADLQHLADNMVFELVLKARPFPEELEPVRIAADQLRNELTDVIRSITKRDLKEIRQFGKPPPACEMVCLATLNLLAGISHPKIAVKRNGSPKDEDWKGCQDMLSFSSFLDDILQLPSHIHDGKMMGPSMLRCRRHIGTIEGNSDSDKILYMGRCSLMCQQLLRWVIGVMNYYDRVTELREKFGGAPMKQLVDHEDLQQQN